jgi:transposase
MLRQFSTTHPAHLTVDQLPAYSPDLSPIEGLWKKLKKQATQLRSVPTLA